MAGDTRVCLRAEYVYLYSYSYAYLTMISGMEAGILAIGYSVVTR